MIVRCPICGRYVKDAQEQSDGTWKGECRECGTVEGNER